MFKLDFKQPIFGSNYLELYCKPLYGMIPAEAHIKVWFQEGGCDKFLRIFDTARSQVREQLRAGKTYHDNTYNQQIAQGFFSGNAYHDPNDPTVVYTHQPQETLSNTQNFYGDNYYQGTNYPEGPQGGIEMQNQPPQQGYPQPQPGYPQQQPGYPQQQPGYPQQQPGYPQQQPGPQNAYYPNGPQPGQQQMGMNTDYPNAPPQQQGQYPPAQNMPMGQPYNQPPNQPYTVGMTNVGGYNTNQPGISYYFGVPIGPTVQRNNNQGH